MGGIPILKVNRCCFCTRKLKVACILIAIWSMWATAHSIRILFCPSCEKQYIEEGGDYYQQMNFIMWVLFGFNIMTMCSSFAFLLGLFLGYKVTADVFMFCGFATAITMLVHAVFTTLQILDSECENSSDVIAHLIYFILWMYFIVIVNSHRDDM